MQIKKLSIPYNTIEYSTNLIQSIEYSIHCIVSNDGTHSNQSLKWP